MPTKKGSWRDKKKGECWARTGKGGATYVVCEGSIGQKGVYKSKRKKAKKPLPSWAPKVKQSEKLWETDKELEKKYGGWSVKELNEKLDNMKGTSSQGTNTKASKIRKIHDKGGRLSLKK